MSLFYDVPCGLVRMRCGTVRMSYALFADPFNATSYAGRMRHNLPGNEPLCVNRREWSPTVLENTPILDFRDN